ncbi:hypothetical protein L6V77_31865 [Myxococcota bacterium]|nr:hypothetical protein [Myxococcota bacterium]
MSRTVRTRVLGALAAGLAISATAAACARIENSTLSGGPEPYDDARTPSPAGGDIGTSGPIPSGDALPGGAGGALQPDAASSGGQAADAEDPAPGGALADASASAGGGGGRPDAGPIEPADAKAEPPPPTPDATTPIDPPDAASPVDPPDATGPVDPPDAGPGPCVPAAEQCDGLDDDCDGLVDEGPDGLPLTLPCFGGPPALAGIGVCLAGVRRCFAGAYEDACVGEVLPGDETCNGLDDDCDGLVDARPGGAALDEICYDGPDGTLDIGVCRAGARLCQGGLAAACLDQVLPSREICDGLDNDCNGLADDTPEACDCLPGEQRRCYGGPAGTDGQGPCTGGVQTCDPDGRFGPCEGQRLPEAEICDGQDNDCNGRADDAVGGTGLACERGVGTCAVVGRVACDGVAGELFCDAIVGEPSPERCNDLDDDCDGETDESLGLGDVCVVGEGACRREGARRCGDDGETVCGAAPGAPEPERCNDADDDCDGAVDEGLGRGEACVVGRGACEARGENVCGPDGAVRCGAEPRPPAPETCNGVDDDCDGETDEADPRLDAPCDTGLPGVCGVGGLSCVDGGLVCVERAVPGVEICDGLDNDCDGRVDVTAAGEPLSRTCYDGPAGTEDRGPCRGGTATCEGGVFGACTGQVLPAAEVCNGADDDCDGTPDDVAGAACQCLPGMTQACYGGPAGTAGRGVCRGGTQTCLADGTGFGPCQGEVLPQLEICNGLDDDCNGALDDPPGAGRGCESGVGACARPGVLTCDPVLGLLVCSAVPGVPAVESCNGVDDDCDGRLDDVAGLGGACRGNDGAGCSPAGTLSCVAGGGPLPVCALRANPPAERCNGVDDDDDLCVDEGISEPVGEVCTVGIGSCQRAGRTTCQGAAGVRCDATPGPSAPEVCNGRDDDCDGVADDAPTDVGLVCSAGVGGCARAGVTTCAAGVPGCSASPGAPVAERCNGTDDDCDGATDEGGICDVFASCLAARDAGRRVSGPVRLQPPGVGAPVDVYCEQGTDGGGWTLVGSSRGSTLNDQGQAWYADLATLAPAAGNLGLWNGLRSLGGRWDVRFACRDAVREAVDPFTVDLSFYDVDWYWTITAGADADSCFAESDGLGAPDPAPARRDSIGGRFLPVGTPYAATGAFYEGDDFLEGEDTCADTTDFTVDFTDRGMDSNQSDGTDWGEDDGSLKCGTSGVATGQWFVFARERGGAPPPACAVEDAFENNDAQAEAWPAPLPFDAPGGLCGTDRDWFAFTGRGGCTYDATLTFTHAQGDVDATLNGADGTQLDISAGVTDSEQLNYTVPAGPGVALALQVYGFAFGAASSNAYRVVITETCP